MSIAPIPRRYAVTMKWADLILITHARYFRDVFLFGTMLHSSGRVGGGIAVCLVIEIVIIRVTLQGQTPFLPSSSPSPFSDFVIARNSSREIGGSARSEFCHCVACRARLRHLVPLLRPAV